MTELAIHQTGAVETTDPALNPVVGALVEWAASARAAHGIATSLVNTSFVPEAFRNKPHEATAAILAGAEVGLMPMAALRSFDVIQGVAAPRANTLRAVVQSKGHDVWLVESTETRAIVDGLRLGSSKVQRSIWTIERARKLKLTGKANWQNQPQAMLVARATSECCRLVASDAILGISSYSAEELWDGDPAEVETTPAAPRTRRTAQRAPLASVPVEEPSLDETPETPEQQAAEAATDQQADTDGAGGDLITAAQLAKLHIQLGENGLGDRDEGLAYLSRRLGRDITTSKDVSKVEASRLIDAFENDTWNDDTAEPPLDAQ